MHQTSYAWFPHHPHSNNHPRSRFFLRSTHQVRLLSQGVPCRRQSQWRHHFWNPWLLHVCRFHDYLLKRYSRIPARSVFLSFPLPRSLPHFQDVNALVGDTTVQIPQVVVKWLTYALVLHIVAFGLAAISAIFGLLAHVREMAMSCFSSCISGLAAAVALAAFVFDIALFFVAKSRMNSVQGGSASIGNAVWLTLAAWILLFFSGCVYGIGRCCLRRRPRDAWGGKVGTPIGENGYNANEQLRLDAVKAEADRKARQAQPEVGLPAFQEYDQFQPLKARVDGEEAYLEEDTPYRDNQSVSTGMGTFSRSARAGYAGGGYVQAPPGTRAVDEYNNSSPFTPRPHRQGSTITHSSVTASTLPSTYPPSSNTAAPVAALYDPSPDNHYNHDPYSPQAYGHNSGASYFTFPTSFINMFSFSDTRQPHIPYDPYSAFSSTSPSQSYGPQNLASPPTVQPDRSYTLSGGAYIANTTSPAPINNPYADPYYGHYQSASNPTSPPMSRSPALINTQVTSVPTSVSPVRGPKGPRTSIVMAPPASIQYSDNPPTYESTPLGAPGQWERRG